MSGGSEQRSERRLAAILAADVAGYSRLMGADEEGTLAALKAIRRELSNPKIAEHHGRIVKTTGDGVLVEFASVVDAVRCAVEVQNAMAERNTDIAAERRIEFRIGINLGDIISDENDIYGDGVNVAARLEALAEPGGICVSRVVRDQVRDRLDIAFDDLGEQQVKNIARPVHVFRVEIGPASGRHAGGTPAVRSAGLPLPDKPSLAVLPFQNMSGDPEQEYFADGMVEEITTAIARLPWLFVIARNSSFTYKGKAVDVKQVGRELGVRYVLEGSVRKAGNRVRVTGQLIDTGTGTHIWADRFDGALDDIFELQDQVASSVAGAIEPKLRQSEIERATRKPTESLDPYDLYLRALAQFNKSTAEGNRAALGLLDEALALDPNYVPAAALSCSCWCARKYQAWAPVSEAEISRVINLARTVCEVGKDDPEALAKAAFAIGYFAGDHETALRASERAVALNPNCASAWRNRAWTQVWTDQPGAAIESFEQAIRLSPLDPQQWGLHFGIARCHFIAGAFDDALGSVEKALFENPRALNAASLRAAICGYLRRADEIHRSVQFLLDLSPGFTVMRNSTSVISPGVSPLVANYWAAGLRKAGLPEE